MENLSSSVMHVDVFKATAITSLFLMVMFLLAVLFSIAWNIKPEEVLISSDEMLFAILSFLTATTATLLSIIIRIPIAYILSRYSFAGKPIVDTLLDLPVVLSPVALGTALLAFFSTPLGKLLDFGFVFGIPGIILAQFTIVVALMVRLMKAGFLLIDAMRM